MRPPPNIVAAVAEIVESAFARWRKQKPLDKSQAIQEPPRRKRHQSGKPARTARPQLGTDQRLAPLPRLPALRAQQQQSAQAPPRLAWTRFPPPCFRNP